MKEVLKTETTVEQYEALLGTPQLVNMQFEQLRNGKFHTFAVDENFNIFISDKFHVHIAEQQGINLDTTLIEGNLRIGTDGKIEIIFKTAVYQPVPGFKGSAEELARLQEATKNKIESFINGSR